MSTARGRKRGFTVVEAMVSLALTGIAVAGVITGLGNLSKSQALMLQRERMQRLAVNKYNEIVAIKDFTTPSGDFTDRYQDNYTWEMQLTQVSTSSIPIGGGTSATSTNQSSQLTSTNLETLTVTVHPSKSSQAQDQVSISGLVYVPSQTTTSTTPTTLGGG